MFTIQPGEKWAAVCLSQAWCEGLGEETDLGDGVWVLQKRPIDLPPHWREWIGSVNADLVHGANLWLAAKIASSKPEVLDEETQGLSRAVSTSFLALHTTIPVEFEIAFILTGANVGGRVEVRQFDQYHHFFHSWGVRGVPVSNDMIAQTREALSGLRGLFGDSGFMRVRRGVNAFWHGLQEQAGEDRLHQFVRSLDAIVKGGGEKDFATRAKVFTGATVEPDLTECYKMRNLSEHLEDIERIIPVAHPRTQEDYLLRRVRRMEMLCRDVYRRLATSRPHRELFRDTAIRKFWKKPEDEQRTLWGPPLDITGIK